MQAAKRNCLFNFNPVSFIPANTSHYDNNTKEFSEIIMIKSMKSEDDYTDNKYHKAV